MAVAVLVFQSFVGVLVLMLLGGGAEAERHEEARDHELGRKGLAEQRDGERAHERREREIGAGARGAEMAQRRQNEDGPMAKKLTTAAAATAPAEGKAARGRARSPG